MFFLNHVLDPRNYHGEMEKKHRSFFVCSGGVRVDLHTNHVVENTNGSNGQRLMVVANPVGPASGRDGAIALRRCAASGAGESRPQ